MKALDSVFPPVLPIDFFHFNVFDPTSGLGGIVFSLSLPFTELAVVSRHARTLIPLLIRPPQTWTTGTRE